MNEGRPFSPARALALLSAYAAFSGLAPAYPADLPEESCRDAWSKLIPLNLHKYHFSRDSRPTQNGNEGYADYAKRTRRKRCYKDWTVLVYMQAANDLQPYSLWDLYEMEAGFQSSAEGAGSTLRTDVIVQLDARDAPATRRLHIFQTDEVYQARTLDYFDSRSVRDIRSPIVQLLRGPGIREDERKAGIAAEARRFQDFLAWAISEYPSRHYWVILWGHGQGWTSRSAPRGMDSPFHWGQAYPEEGRQALDTPSLARVLSSVSLSLGRKIDFYTSDACFMQTIEVAQELAPFARFTSGASQVQSLLGLPYRRILYELNSRRFNGEREALPSGPLAGDEPYLLARMLPKLTLQSFNISRGSQGRSDPHSHAYLATSSLDNEALLALLLPSLSDLSRALRDYLSEEPLRRLDLLFQLQKARSSHAGQAARGPALDLGIFLGLLRRQLDREAEQEALARKAPGSKANALLSTVIQTEKNLELSIVSHVAEAPSQLNDRYSAARSGPKALSVWMPTSSREYRERIHEFLASGFYRQAHWNDWLELLFHPNSN